MEIETIVECDPFDWGNDSYWMDSLITSYFVFFKISIICRDDILMEIFERDY